ncbi:GNAT family N-acetyltransferase [Massilia horti]|uniref:GNAT family N-acetyltransferase n=1 Tax=Massilia horti TaxID=2562153 RepID=A0A4Y9T3L7_9BURK|nr:GNAT family N-acetyltransferase [Massilia horti]TFW34375.1 GNAT family N-acetyltransferase [Massilia horti]
MNVAENAGLNHLAEISQVRLAVSHDEAEQGLEVRIYEADIPQFAAAELDRLYQSIYCTLTRFHIYGEANDASTYVARLRGTVVSLILFRLERGVVRVLNQQIALSQAELLRFSQVIFNIYPAARRIAFYAIDARLTNFPFPFQACPVLEENLLTLPHSRQEYAAAISEALWTRIQAGERKLRRDHPDYRFEVLAGDAVSEQQLRRIIALAGARTAAKQRDAYLHEEDVSRILQLVHAYGFVGVLSVGGTVRAGNVFYRVGQRYFMHLIAHDPDYDKYMLGNLVQFLATCHCIERGGRECYLMGGGREHKARFRALPKYFDSVDIYRSRLVFLLCLARVGQGAARRWLRHMREDLSRMAHTDSAGGRFAARCLALARTVKRSTRGAAAQRK